MFEGVQTPRHLQTLPMATDPNCELSNSRGAPEPLAQQHQMPQPGAECVAARGCLQSPHCSAAWTNRSAFMETRLEQPCRAAGTEPPDTGTIQTPCPDPARSHRARLGTDPLLAALLILTTANPIPTEGRTPRSSQNHWHSPCSWASRGSDIHTHLE